MTNKFTLRAYLIHLDEVIVILNEAKSYFAWSESVEIKMSYMKVNSSYKDQNIYLKKIKFFFN